MTWLKRLIIIAGLFFLIIGVVSCRSEPATAVATSNLTDLTDIAQLQTAFADGEGKPRLLLILSPT